MDQQVHFQGETSRLLTCFEFMHLSLQTDYALRTLLFLGGRTERSQIHQIADFYRISKDHVAKVVQHLAKLGLVRTIRGIGGGLEMGKPPETISVGEVIRAFEGKLHLLDCVGAENVCVIQPKCRLRLVLAEAERLQWEYLSSVCLSDLLLTPTELVSLQIPASVTP
jgi:Rrf2 family transcriptional regulator, nitric oxide-sensitive transcriptional repressor